MPVRRASAGHNIAGSSSRVHRSNGSNHSVSAQAAQSPSSQAQNLPYGSSGGQPATPQQKVVYVLVNRLKNKLPCNSGIGLTDIEGDDAIAQVIESLVELSRDSLDFIGWALSELLEKLAKQTDSTGFKSIDVLQSQLFILKVLSIAMASRWGRRSDGTRPSSRNSKPQGSTSKPEPPESPAPSSQGSRPQQASSEHLSSMISEPPPLDENCAKYILSVMVMCLRQTAPAKHRLMSAANLNFAASYHDFESVENPEDSALDIMYTGPVKLPSTSGQPRSINRAKHASSTSLNSGTPSSGSFGASKHTLTYEKTLSVTSKSMMLLNNMIASFAGKIVYHLSASNWQIVLSRIRNKIHYLASTTDTDPDIVDLQLMTYGVLDKVRLTQSLQALSSLLVNMKREAQAAVAIPLRAAIWNWIDLFPDELSDTVRNRKRLEGAPERVFDILYELYESKSGREKDKPSITIWPTLTALMIISPDRLKPEQSTVKAFYNRKDRNFAELITWAMTVQGPFTEAGIICALDVCRAAFRLRPEDGTDTALQLVASEFAHALQGALSQWNGTKPFWECPEEIDVALIADVLVTVYRYKPQEQSLALFALCLEPERSYAVKICALKAIMTLIAEAPYLPWQCPIDGLRDTVANRVPLIFASAALRRHEVDQYGVVRRVLLRPKAKRYTSETLPDRDLVAISMLTLTRQYPAWFFAHLDNSSEPVWVSGTIEQWHVPMDPAIKMSLARTFRNVCDAVIKMRPEHPKYEIVGPWLSVVYPATLATVCTNLLHSRTDLHAQRMWIHIAYELMYRYTQQWEYPFKAVRDSEARLSAFALGEISFLVSLTSADTNVAVTAAHCLRLLALAETMPTAPVNTVVPEEERVKRYPIYEQLGDPHVIAIGRVGMQKRVRKFMRLMTFHSPVHVAVWQECYWRWCALNELTIRMSIEATTDGFDSGTAPIGDKVLSVDERQAQWQNLTLFMAAFGAAGSRDNSDASILTQTISAYYLPDQMRNLRDTTELVGSFIQELLDLLISESVKAREVAKEALGSEMSPRLYSRVFKELDNVIRLLTEGDNINSESLAVFLDQSVTILKVLIDNVQNFEEIRGLDITSTLFVLAGFIGRFHDLVSYRLRIRFCGLCDTVFQRAEAITMRKDNIARQKILDIVIEWVQDPSLCSQELLQSQRELNSAAFRTVNALLDRLQLQPADGSTGEEATHAVSRMFIRYMNFLVRAWEHSRALGAPYDDGTSEMSSNSHMRTLHLGTEVRSLVLSSLASLISTNTECGVKHCLPLAYETDLSKRVLFAHVFTRVLAQGIKFSAQDSQPVVNRQSRLCELVKGPDMMLALAICEVCPPSEVDNLISVMINLFDTKKSLMTLLKMMIDLEVGRTDSDTSLFRGNSTCTRFLSSFASNYGYNYLRGIINPLIKTMTSMPPGNGYDLDPAKVGEAQARKNQANVELVASSFLQIISSSISTLPSMFREICAHIAKVVNEVWPEAKFAAVGAFMFLRFISPAIVSPDSIDIEMPKDDPGLRRGLMVIAKIIQNLANNIFFGKEAHMVVLNDFLTANIINVTRFLNELKKWSPPGPDEEAEDWLDATYDDTDTIVLHRFFEKHADKVGKELLSLAKGPSDKPTPESEASALNGKRIWDSLCGALVELGQPLETPRVSVLQGRDHREYLDMMARYDFKDTSSVRDLFVKADVPGPLGKEMAVFVLSVSKIDVEILDIELLLYYIFKTLTSPPHDHLDFDIVFDFTSFSSTSQMPALWLKFAHELIPLDLRERFKYSRILSPNDLAIKYLKRLYNLSSGSSLSENYATYPTVADLLKQYPEGTSMPALSYAVQLESEDAISFGETTMRHARPMRVPVTLQIAMSHLRITTTKALLICNSLSCKATEIVPLSDINDVYNVSTGQDAHEFIIRKIRQGVTLYFSSPFRDAIVKTTRAAKGNMQTLQLPGAERLSRLSNVVTTLLHIGMLGMCSDDDDLRNTAYELLSAVCTYLDYDKRPLVPSKIVFINGPPGPFLVQLSEGLATFAPQLTLDFISEVSAGLIKSSIPEKINSLQYLCPWIKNTVHFTNPTSPYFEHSGSKFRDCIRGLVDVTLAEQELMQLVQRYIWAEIGKLDSSVVNVVFDELMRAAVDGGMGSARAERVADTMGAVSSIHIRGKVLTRLRKVVGKTSTKPTKNLADNVHWNEIACLCRVGLVVSYQHKNAVHSQVYVPETFHLAALISGTGQTHVRTSIYGIIVNLLNSLYISRLSDTTSSGQIHQLILECEQPETLRLFGLVRLSTTSDYHNFEPPNDKVYVDSLESLVRFFVRILDTIASSIGIVNVWRARWMSLITSSAFQLSPAVQTRAFVALGVLATSDVDDDLLYQMLVAFKTALSQSSENDTTSVVSMLRCIRNVVPALPRNSRYLCQLFWLAVALLQSSHIALYQEAIHLLRVALEVMNEQGAFDEKGVSATLLDGRIPLEDVACQLDQLLGLSFDSSFSFSLASIIFKGVRHSGLRDSAEAVLRSALSITVRNCRDAEHADDGPGTPVCQDALGYFLALLPMSTTTLAYKTLLEQANVDASWLSDEVLANKSDDEWMTKVPFTLLGLSESNSVLFVTSFVGAMLATAQGDDAESLILYHLLSDIADAAPDTISLAYDSLQDKIKDTFANASNPAILNTVSNVFRVAMMDPERAIPARGSASTLSTVDEATTHGPGRGHLYALEEHGMQGLANSFQFLPANRGHATKMINWISELVMKIIE